VNVTEEIEALRGTRPATLVNLLRLPHFSRLWRAMLVSSLGDWVGFVAITSIVTRLGGDQAGFAVAGVMLARLLPSITFGPFAGVLVDRFDRRRLMMTADLVRSAAHFTMPFLGSLPAIYAVSFLVESATLLWSPSRDASIPNLVPRRQLVNAGTVVLATSYGTLPLSGLVFTGLAGIGGALGGQIAFFAGRPEAPALFLDSLTFLFSAWMIRGLALRRPLRRPRQVGGQKSRALAEFAEGVRFLYGHALARAMTIGIVFAFAGAGSVIALGPIFAKQVLGAGPEGWGVLVTSLGIGMAAGMLSVRLVGRVVDRQVAFTTSMMSTALVLLVLSAMPNLASAAVLTLLMGIGAGITWVSGYTLLHENVTDDLRGRTFGSLAVLVRLGLFLALSGFPALSQAFGNPVLSLGDADIPVAGARLALAAGAVVTLGGGLLSRGGLARSRLARSRPCVSSLASNRSTRAEP
jgi:dTMP kinase